MAIDQYTGTPQFILISSEQETQGYLCRKEVSAQTMTPWDMNTLTSWDMNTMTPWDMNIDNIMCCMHLAIHSFVQSQRIWSVHAVSDRKCPSVFCDFVILD